MQFLPVLHQHVHWQICMVLKAPKPIGMVEEDSLEPEAPLVWSSLRTDWREMNFDCSLLARAHGHQLWVRQKMSIRRTCDGNRMERTPWTRQVEPIMNNGIAIGPSYSALVLAKWSIAKCSTSRQLTLSQFVPLPMHGWKWPVLEMSRIPGTCLSHHTRITAMHVCDSRFDKHWHGAKSSQLRRNQVQEWASSVRSVMLAALGTDLWRKGRVQHRLFIRRFMI